MNDRQHPEHLASTNWSQLGLAAQGDPEALNRLLQLHLPSLRLRARIHFRLDPDTIDEHIHEFVTSRILEGNLLAHAEPEKGKFRHFLQRSLLNFINSRLSKEARRNQLLRSAVAGAADANPHPETEGDAAADIAWAHTLVGSVVDAMKSDCRAKNQDHLWEIFRGRFWKPLLSGEPPESFESLATSLGLNDPQQARLALWTAKKKFRTLFLRRLTDESGDVALADQELDDLIALLGRNSPRQDALLRDLFVECAEDHSSALESVTAGSMIVADFLQQLAPDTPDSPGELSGEGLLEHSVADFIDLAGGLSELQRKALLPPAEQLQTLLELFADSEATIATLLLVKDAARRECNDHGKLTRELALSVYYLAIAAALVTGGRAVTSKITSLRTDKKREGFDFLLTQPWLPEILREIVGKARQANLT